MHHNSTGNVSQKRKRGAQGDASPPAKKGGKVKIYNTEEKPSVTQQQSLQLVVVTWSLLTVAPEIQLLILQHCNAMALSLIDQVCKALSTPRPPLSLLQRAVQNKLRSEYPSTSLNVESWPAHLAKIEHAHRAGSSWEDPTVEVMR